MNTINLLNKEYEIISEYDSAICLYDTVGTKINNLSNSNVEIKLKQKVYNVKILLKKSVIFTISPDSEDYIITMSYKLFGFPTDNQIKEIEELENIRNKAIEDLKNIYDSIERIGVKLNK